MPPSSDQDRRLEDQPRTAEATLHFVLDVDWVSPSIARDRLRRWLAAHRWSPAHIDDLVLALNEAVSNSIEHGFGLTVPAEDDLTWPDPPVEVHGRVVTEPDGTRHVELTVRDQGSWRAPTGGSGSSRGHGVTIMRACTEEVTVDRGADGTTIVLRSRSIPAPLT